MAETLLTGNDKDLFAWFVALESDRPYDARRLERLLEWMPEDLSADETSMIRRYFKALIRQTPPEAAPDRPASEPTSDEASRTGETPR